jgi:iron complex transport system permease protein
VRGDVALRPAADPASGSAPGGYDAALLEVRTQVRATFARRRRRYAGVTTALVVGLVAVLVLSLALGDISVSPLDIGKAIIGQADARTHFVIVELRLPRLTLAVLVGLGLALAGALFQSVLRNPLASPDIIGVSQGASAGAVAALLLLDLPEIWAAPFALAGAMAVGVILYAVSWRGGLTGFRFVLSGVGLSYLAAAFTGYLLSRADVQQAQTALTWLSGSVGSAQWSTVKLLAIALAVLVPIALLVGPSLSMLLLGDETAASLGTRPERVRLVVILTGIFLAAVATAAAGPIAFVALIAPSIARRLLGDGTLALVPSALTGALLVALADVVAQHVLSGDFQAPAGVVTGVIGGPYLIWLLATSRRGRKAA